jgi:hypothetical protein
MAKEQKKQNDELILEEFDKIKNLLILLLYGMHFPSSEIGKAAKIDSSTVRGMFSKKIIVKARGKKEGGNEQK